MKANTTRIQTFKTILQYKLDIQQLINYIQKYMENKIIIKDLDVTMAKIDMKYIINNPLFRGKIYNWKWNYMNVKKEGIDLDIAKAINAYVIVKGKKLGMIANESKI